MRSRKDKLYRSRLDKRPIAIKAYERFVNFIMEQHMPEFDEAFIASVLYGGTPQTWLDVNRDKRALGIKG